MDLTKESSDFKIKMDCHAKPTDFLAMTNYLNIVIARERSDRSNPLTQKLKQNLGGGKGQKIQNRT